MVRYTKRTFTLLLKKYGLARDVESLEKNGFENPKDIWWLDPTDVKKLQLKGTLPFDKHTRYTRYRMKAIWSQYCKIYKQETGKDHPDA